MTTLLDEAGVVLRMIVDNEEISQDLRTSANWVLIQIDAAQQSVQADACYCCRDGGCQAGCRCQEFVGDAD